MKKCMWFMTVFTMIFALLTTSAQAAGEKSLVQNKSEDFTGLIITEATAATQSLALSGDNGLGAKNIRVNNAAVSILSDGMGGKPQTDKYLRATRNGADGVSGGYYYFISFRNAGYRYTTGNPVTVSFSVYAPEDLGDDNFFCQFGPEAENSTNSPIGAVYFVTNESAAVDGKGVLWDHRFLVNAGEWNRVSITMYPNTKDTVVAVNGKSYSFDTVNQSRTYGEYLNTLKVVLPNRAGKTDEFMAYDDFVIYAGAGAEPYTAPANALTAVGGTALVGEDTVYITGEFNESDFSVEGGELCVIKDENEKAVKLAVWVKGNPVPKYYDIRTVEGNDLVAVSLTADADNHAFVAKGFANGDAGTVIAAAYSKEDNQLLHVTVQNIANEYEGYGSFVKSIPIADYDSEKIYKAFWWSSMETMNPLLRCNFENASERN